MTPRDTEALCGWLLEKERRLGLLARSCLGVRLWEAYRVNAFYIVARQLGILDTQADSRAPGPARELPPPAELRREQPRWAAQRADVLLVGSRVRYERDGVPQDIYTEAFRERASAQGLRVTQLGLQPRAQRSAAERENLDYALHLAQAWGRKKWLIRFARAWIQLRFRDVLRALRDELGIEPRPLVLFLAVNLIKFHVLRLMALRALVMKRPREVVAVSPYGIPWLPAAAKLLRIPLVELQHGVISPAHLAYHYPDTRPGTLRYFPDRMLLWSEAWRDAAALPLPPGRIDYLPLKMLEDLKRSAGGVPREPELLVVSQATVGARLAELLLQALPPDFEFRVRFRLHPRERHKSRQYAALAQLLASGRVVLDTDGSIYPGLLRAGAVLGCYSTALYEAAELGCTVYVAPLPGSEQMRGLVAAGRARRLESAADWERLRGELRAVALAAAHQRASSISH